jgi:hypothetical protein
MNLRTRLSRSNGRRKLGFRIYLPFLLLMLVSCQSKWDTKIGSYSVDDALAEYGRPFKSSTLYSGKKVYQWMQHGGPWLILVFDYQGQLISARETSY